jgi:uncharacterized SAM-binding protein YcdF (DUF218 family)
MRARRVEDRSRNTHENAFARQKSCARTVHRVILVAHDFDMRRTAEFADAGISTIPAATGLTADTALTPLDFLPSISGLRGSCYAIYEICANWVRWLTHAR